MKRLPRLLSTATLTALVVLSAQAQINNNPPGGSGPGRGRGPGVEASVVTAARSPEVNANGTITFRLQAPNAKTVRVFTDFPKLGEVPVNGSAGFDMTKEHTLHISWTNEGKEWTFSLDNDESSVQKKFITRRLIPKGAGLVTHDLRATYLRCFTR